MPSSGSGFSVIKEYCNLAKHLDVEHEAPSCKDMVSLDQEVPQIRSYLEQGDFCNTDIKMEPASNTDADFYAFMNMFDNMPATTTSVSSNTSITNSSTIEARIPPMTTAHQSEFPNFFSSPTDSLSSMPSSLSVPTGLQHAMVSSSSLSSSLHSSSSPMLSSTIFTSTPSSTPTPPLSSSHTDITIKSPATSQHQGNSTVKTSSFVSSLSGSGGCVVMSPAQPQPTEYLSGEVFTMPGSTPNFLNNSTLPSFGVPEDNLDYLDLDKQPSSFYEDMKIPCEPVKPMVENQMDSLPLEEAALMMRDVIHHDCDSLKVPYDPMLWTSDHVRTWVSWVCQKNRLTDVSSVAVSMTGRFLCSLNENEFLRHYGSAGDSICTELELWKAANSCFPETQYSNMQSTTRMGPMQMSVPQISSLLDPEPMVHHVPYSVNVKSRMSTPCVSPAPSSTSQDSNQGSSGAMEGSSDNSDDEYSSGDSLSFSGSSKVGRGHKQTIHLWQFLRELLLSKENHTDCIRWLDRKAGIFKIEDSKKVAYLWGQRKNRPAMNYDKLSRSVRQYYKKKIIKKTEQTKRLVYQFCPGYL